MGRRSSLSVLVGAVLWTTMVAAPPAEAAPPAPSLVPTSSLADRYVPLTPARLMDTRTIGVTVDHQDEAGGPLGAGTVHELTVLDRGGVPASGVAAVALQLTSTGATQRTWITAYPHGDSVPGTSNLNPEPFQVRSNLVIVPVGADGKVDLRNALGSVHLIVDVQGWVPTADAFTPVTPTRLLDTRATSALTAGATVDVEIGGVAGVPASGVGAVVINLTALTASQRTWLTAYPKGSALPATSNVNVNGNAPEANLALVPLGDDGSITIRNAVGTVHAIVDVLGWVPEGPRYNPIEPVRVVDTRPGDPLGAGEVVTVDADTVPGVPAGGVGALVFNLTALNATTGTWLTVYPGGEGVPIGSNANPRVGAVSANLVIAKVNADGEVAIRNANGSVDALVDVVGWLPSDVQATADTATVTEDDAATALDVLANDTDGDGRPLLIETVDQPANGTVEITGGGTGVTYEPDADYCNNPPGGSPDTFTYHLFGGVSSPVAVTVDCVDDAPVAVNDSDTVSEDSADNAIDVLANDTDVDGGTRLVTSITQPVNGSATITGGGTGVSYTPNENVCNDPTGPAESFDYTLNGGSTATVTITITCADDAPVAVADTATVAEDSADNAIDVLANDTDVDGGTMLVQSATDPAHGTASVTGGGTGVDYTPDANFCGEDTFDYTLNGGDSATVTVTVTCGDDASVAVADSVSLDEDSPATPLGVRGNDTDIDGSVELISSRTDPGHGTATVTGGGTDISYTPAANYCGPDDFDYTLAGGSSATVSITVTCVDDAPVAVADPASVAEDAAATAVSVLANDTDIDGGPISIASATQPANGTVVITGGGTGLTYQPDPNYCNTPPGSSLDTFTYTLTPGGSTGVVTVTVNCVDDNPVAVNDSATVAEDSSATAVDVLANDTDPDGGAISIASVTQPANGTVAVTGGGTGLTYQPDANYCNNPPGSPLDTFTYTLAPGGSQGTVGVTVNCVDDAPVAVDDPTTVSEDSGATAIDVLDNDTDIDGGPKSIASVTQPANGTVVITGGGTGLTYAPDANYCNNPPGSSLDTFTYTLAPGGDTATVTVTVTCVDDAPTAPDLDFDGVANMRIDVAAGSGLLSGAADVDGPGPVVLGTVGSSSPAGAVISSNADGSFSFTPPPGVTGDVTFTYTVCDSTTPTPVCSADATVTVTVAGPVVWFVAPPAGGAGGNGGLLSVGTLDNPFDGLADAQTALAATSGARVFVLSGSYPESYAMPASSWLIGQQYAAPGGFDSYFGITAVTGLQSRPAVGTGTVTIGGQVTLGSSSTVRGLTIVSSGSKGLVGTSVTTDVAAVSINISGFTALDLTSVGGTVHPTSVTATGGATGISIVNGTATVTVDAGSVSGTTTNAVIIDGGTGSVTFASSFTLGTISSGRTLAVQNRGASATVSLAGPITATGGTGIRLSTNNATSSVSLTGTITLSTGANGAIDAVNGGVLQTASTNQGSTLTTTTGMALKLASTRIGANGLVFQSISANGASNGILLNDTGVGAGDGSLSVVGTGAANSGGTIQNTTGAGVVLTLTKAPSFARVRIINTQGSGIEGTSVVGFTLSDSVLDSNGSVASTDTSNLAFNQTALGTEANLTGTVSITNNTLTNAAWHGIDIRNFSGTLSSLTITGNTITSSTSTASSKGSGIRLQALGSTSGAATVSGATISTNIITNFPSGSGVIVQGGNTAGSPAGQFGTVGTPIAVTLNTIRGASTANPMAVNAISATVNGNGTAYFNLSNNGTAGSPLANVAGTVILTGVNGNATGTFTVNNNYIANAGASLFGSNGIGGGTGTITSNNTEAPTMTITASGNTLSGHDGNGILLVARGASGLLNATVQNNTVGAPAGGIRDGIRIDAGNASSANDRVCLSISGNTSAGSGLATGIGLRQQATVGTFGIVGLNPPSGASTAQVTNYVNTLNPGSPGTEIIAGTVFSACSLGV